MFTQRYYQLKTKCLTLPRCLTLSQYDVVSLITDHSSQSNLCTNAWLTDQSFLLELFVNQFHEQFPYPTSAYPHCSYGEFADVTYDIRTEQSNSQL